MHLYNLTLQGQTAINQAIHGNFSGIPKAQVKIISFSLLYLFMANFCRRFVSVFHSCLYIEYIIRATCLSIVIF
uniref:Uncharacterized protein n=1 Tax=Heterorhabditis bacteriophora TaxID=37862 RepID=A0A1I7WTA1_HETBA